MFIDQAMKCFCTPLGVKGAVTIEDPHNRQNPSDDARTSHRCAALKYGTPKGVRDALSS
jgi:hypothetical protein